MTVTPQQTLAHLRRLEHDRRHREEVRAEGLRDGAARAVAMLRERYGVTEARLFGPLAVGDLSAESTVNLAVRDLSGQHYFAALADVMERIGGPVDLVRIEEASGPLRERIESEGKVV